MGLKLHTQWFDKQTEEFINEEFSVDFDDDDFLIIKTINSSEENIINNGVFNLDNEWISEIQKYVKHKIDVSKYLYQVSFDYRDQW